MLSAANEAGAGGHQATETNRPIATTQPFAATTNKVSEYVPVTTKKYARELLFVSHRHAHELSHRGPWEKRTNRGR